jgi:phosphoserine phosphatase
LEQFDDFKKRTSVVQNGSKTPVSSLSPADFQASALEILLSSPNPTAVFDCDGTLWSPDAGSSFMHHTIDTGLLSRSAIDWLDARYRAYKRGEVSELAICGEMVQVYQGLREDEVRRAARDFFHARIRPHVFPELQTLIATLQSHHVDIWAVSSTNDWVIEEGVKLFHIPANRILAARVDITGGIITNRILDVPTDQGKVDSLARAGITRPDAVFGNSVHDAAMLAIARRAFPVNPSAALVQRSTTENWPIFYPASVAPPPPQPN